MQAGLHQEIKRVDLLQCLLHQRRLAFLERNQKRQLRFRAARFLHHRIDVDIALGKNCGEAGDDARAILYQEA